MQVCTLQLAREALLVQERLPFRKDKVLVGVVVGVLWLVDTFPTFLPHDARGEYV